ncbi:MAG: hypothetical protein M3N47_04445 [Chloroflexota bacterium]|nr:hypothetical protein [Chloroflexota bacterium]
MFAAGLEQKRQQEADRKSPKAKAEREASRTRSIGLSASQSRALGRITFPEAFTGALFDGERPGRGLKIVQYRGGGVGVAETSTGERLLVQSSARLRARTSAGEMAPVDLSLRETTDAFSTTNSNAGVRISKDPTAGADLLGSGVTVALQTDRRSTGTAGDGRVFYGDIDTDTDYVVAPLPDGGEFSWLLRSPNAPERFVLDLKIPQGAKVRRAQSKNPIPGDPPDNLEIVDGDKVLGYIKAPRAYDAEHLPIESELVILDDSRVAMTVEHHGRDLRYPLLADPEVVVPNDYSRGWTGWRNWYTHGSNWNETTNHYGFALFDPAYNPNGLYLSMPTHTYFWPQGTGINWGYHAPVDTYVYRTVMGSVGHSPLPSWYAYGYLFSHLYSGILNPASNNWEAGQSWLTNYGSGGQGIFGPYGYSVGSLHLDHCFETRCNRAVGSEQNQAVLGLAAINNYNSNNIYTGAEKATVTMNAAAVFLGDRHNPWMRSDSQPPNRDWSDDSANRTHTLPGVTAEDRGLGVYGITLAGAASGNGTLRPSCDGNPNGNYCPKAWTAYGFSYQLSEGSTRLSLTPTDIVDNSGAALTWSEKIDRSAPDVSVSGGLRDLAAGIDDSGRDLYELNITATDGTPSNPRVGVRDVVVSVDGNEIERLISDADCVESCKVSDEIFFDTDDLSEGQHTISVQATDRLGHASTPISWTIHVPREQHYTAKVAAWKADIERRVDDAVPLVSLTGPMPTPPDDWRRESDCEASIDALRGCYEAIQTWAEAVRTWLSHNLAVLSLAGELPNPPTFEYTKASDSTGLELTRSTRDAFELAKTALASPLDQLNVSIAFHDPVTPTAALDALPELAAPDQVALTGVFGPDDADISGTMSSPTPVLLSEAIEDLYNQQVTIAREDIADVEAIVAEDADEAEVNQQFISEHQAFVAALQTRQPFITGIGAKMPLPALLDNLVDLDAANVIKSIRLLPADQPIGTGIELLSETRTNTAVVRAAQRRQATSTATATANTDFPPGAPRCYDPGAGGRGPMRNNVLDPTPTYWAPSRHSANTSIGAPDGARHLKVHRLRWRWKAAESLAWMCSDSPGDRNVEIEAKVYPNDNERWSDNWESNNARKYTQHNGPAGGKIHQDDIATGKTFPFVDKQRYPDFSIVFQSSREFRYRRLYKVRFVTNEGHTDDTDSRVIYSVQATSRGTGKLFNATIDEADYCDLRGDDYKSCMFARATACVRHEPITSGWRGSIVDWRQMMGSDATRLRTIRKNNPTVLDRDEEGQITARCDPRP